MTTGTLAITSTRSDRSNRQRTTPTGASQTSRTCCSPTADEVCQPLPRAGRQTKPTHTARTLGATLPTIYGTCQIARLRSSSCTATTHCSLVNGHLRHVLSKEHLRNRSYVRRCFALAGPSTWNSLPDSLRDPALSLSIFRRQLKTHLLAKY